MGQPRSGQSIQQHPQEQILAARKKLTDAKTEEERQTARAQLRKLLSDIFAQDMREREQTAAEIESRLAALRKQYQSREKVKDEIIDLQLKVIEQDAAGLGFPGGESFVPTRSSRAGGSKFGSSGFLPPPTSNKRMAGAYYLPASRVDKHNPIPKQRTLEDVKKSDPAALKDRGHFIESADGKLYAYSNVNFPNGPSIRR